MFENTNLDDTISAIATASGRSGIGVVRVSGSKSLFIIEQLFRPREQRPLCANTARVGHIFDPQSGEIVDEAVVTFFQKPKSYTGDDLVEISCHGSPVILRRVLELTIEQGARLAHPGEFTLRAFLNGRIDLTQAEAVRDLIEAQTLHQAKVAVQQLQGSLSKQLQPIKEALKEMIVHLETAVEFVEDDVKPESLDLMTAKLDDLLKELTILEQSFGYGRILREGIELVIIGRPNVGKSSIFNRLLNKDRAIVTDIPGTTRDTLSDAVSIAGIPVHITDTAGIRSATDPVEKLGVIRTRTAMTDADLILVVLDGADELTQEDLSILSETHLFPRLIALNKSDLPSRFTPDRIESVASNSPCISVSALTGLGIEELRKKIVEMVTQHSNVAIENVILTNSRHHELIVHVIESLKEARKAAEEGYSEEVVLVGLHQGLRLLGEITGETTIEDILDKIFSTFCIGK